MDNVVLVGREIRLGQGEVIGVGAGCPVILPGIKLGREGGGGKVEVSAMIGSKTCRWKWRKEGGGAVKWHPVRCTGGYGVGIGAVGRIRIDDLSSIVTVSKCSWRWSGDRYCVAELCGIVV